MMTNGSELMSTLAMSRADARGNATAPKQLRMRAVPCALCLSALFICGASSEMFAQKKSGTASRATTTKRGQKTSVPVRKRRANALATTGAAKAGIIKDADAKEASTTVSPVSEAASNSEDGVEAVTRATAVAAGDTETLDGLRDGIKEAKSDVERARLERRLVERLNTEATRGESLVELRAMLEGERFDPQFYYNIGNMLARMNDPNAAATAYRKAIKQRKGNYPRALNNLGVVLLRAGDAAEAEVAFLDALRQEQFTYPEAHYNLGRLYQARGETDLAIRQWQRAIRLNPTHTPATLLLAAARAADGDQEEALKILAAARPADDEARRSVADARRKILEDTVLPTTVSKVVETTGASPRAASRNRTTTKSSASRYQLNANSLALFNTARDRRDEGKYEDAAQIYRRVIASQGDKFPPAELELAYALISMRQTPEATKILTALAARNGSEIPIAFYHLARLQEKAGELDSAGANYTRAIAAFGDRNPQFMLDLARIRERQGDYPAALTAFEAYVAANKRNGTDVEWAEGRLTVLRGKANVSVTPQSVTSKP